MASVVNNAKNNDNNNSSNTNEKKDSSNTLGSPPPTVMIPETEENKHARKLKERNLLRSQIYYGNLGKLTAAEEAQKRAKENLAKASERAKKFLKVFEKKEDTKLPFAIIGVPHKQAGGFYSAKEIPDVITCPNYSKDNDIHKCTEYCKRRYGATLSESKACLLQ